MRLRSLAVIVCAAGLLLVTGGPVSLAQQPQQRSLFQLFWQLPAKPQRMAPQTRQRVAPAARRREAPVVVRDDPVIPKVDVTSHVVVMGDSLANLLANGLDDALNNRPDIAVVGRGGVECLHKRALLHLRQCEAAALVEVEEVRQAAERDALVVVVDREPDIGEVALHAEQRANGRGLINSSISAGAGDSVSGSPRSAGSARRAVTASSSSVDEDSTGTAAFDSVGVTSG